MKKCCVLLMALCLLAGCTPLLEREYSTVEPHSSKFWESEAAGTLRAENYQDIVNDLLILIGQHTETATLRLYNVDSKLQAADQALREQLEALPEPEDVQQLAAMLNGGQPADPAQRTQQMLCEQVASNKRRLAQIIERDKMLNQRLGREKSAYQ